MHIHILGICGTFMGGVAALAREAGHRVTGCDAGVYPPMSDQLRALGIELIEGYRADQLALKPDMFVIGNVVSRARLADGAPKFPLMEAILDAGLIRMRPVLITVGATVTALFPLAMHGGPLWEALCYAQIGGLAVATFVTLLMVPVLYAIAAFDLKVVR